MGVGGRGRDQKITTEVATQKHPLCFTDNYAFFPRVPATTSQKKGIKACPDVTCVVRCTAPTRREFVMFLRAHK